MDARKLLIDSFHAAVGAADPLRIVAEHLPAPPAGRTLVAGAGKAAAAMARAVESAWPAAAPLEGLVVTRYGHGVATQRVRVIEAGHPLPDDAGMQAAAQILEHVAGLGPQDRLLALISGGGSSLLPLPAAAVPIADLQSVTRALLKSGAPITDINVVRKHLSRIQGGRLAAACKAPVTALIISDVAGDDLAAVASGPTCPDSSTYRDATEVLRRYGITPPSTVARHFSRGERGEIAETPKPGDPVFSGVENILIGRARTSLEAAAAFFVSQGIAAAMLGDDLTGEASELARSHASLARGIGRGEASFRPPVALISGGECTVTVRGKGRGGRCAEYLAALTAELRGLPGVYAIAADTDGIDGTEDNAGAIMMPESFGRGKAAGLDLLSMLADNDAYSYFSALGDLLMTGPTRTNVNDYRAILVL